MRQYDVNIVIGDEKRFGLGFVDQVWLEMFWVRVLVGQVWRVSATGGHKFNAIATINDFQMICDLFLGAKFSPTLEIEFEKERKKGRSLSWYDDRGENM